MSLSDFFKKKDSAVVAKDRLKIMLAHERTSCNFPYLEDLRNDIIEVIKKYTNVKDVKIKQENEQNLDVLEIDILLAWIKCEGLVTRV